MLRLTLFFLRKSRKYAKLTISESFGISTILADYLIEGFSRLYGCCVQ